MGISPLEMERAPRSRVLEWLHYSNELTAYRQFRMDEAEWKSRAGAERIH